jgi:hypothetical protein
MSRRTATHESDIDVVRIGHKQPAPIKRDYQKRLISYIDYDAHTFCDLCDRGSLFFYHVFREGHLLEGS